MPRKPNKNRTRARPSVTNFGYAPDQPKHEGLAVDWEIKEAMQFVKNIQGFPTVSKIFSMEKNQLFLGAEVTNIDGECTAHGLVKIYMMMLEHHMLVPGTPQVICDLGAGRGKPAGIFLTLNECLRCINIEIRADAVYKALEILAQLPSNIQNRMAHFNYDLMKIQALPQGVIVVYSYDCRLNPEVLKHMGRLYSNSKDLKFIVSFRSLEQIEQDSTFPPLELLGSCVVKMSGSGDTHTAFFYKILDRGDVTEKMDEDEGGVVDEAEAASLQQEMDRHVDLLLDPSKIAQVELLRAELKKQLYDTLHNIGKRRRQAEGFYKAQGSCDENASEGDSSEKDVSEHEEQDEDEDEDEDEDVVSEDEDEDEEVVVSEDEDLESEDDPFARKTRAGVPANKGTKTEGGSKKKKNGVAKEKRLRPPKRLRSPKNIHQNEKFLSDLSAKLNGAMDGGRYHL